jgi:hypothetical protein
MTLTPKDLIAGLAVLRPGAQYSYRQDEKTRGFTLEWLDAGSKAPSESEISVAAQSVSYKAERAAKYDLQGDQLDRFTKVLKYLKTQGIDIGPDGEAQIAMSDDVKAEFPKGAI